MKREERFSGGPFFTSHFTGFFVPSGLILVLIPYYLRRYDKLIRDAFFATSDWSGHQTQPKGDEARRPRGTRVGVHQKD